MAFGTEEKLKTSLVLVTIGLASLGKGKELKDVGTLCIGLVVGDTIYSQELHLASSERTHWIEKASAKALEYLYRHIC